jgi:hypothetical protein
MDIESIPIVKFTVENMRQQILSHLGVVGSDLGLALDASIKKAILEYDFDSAVRDAFNAEVTVAINSFFRNGPGRDAIHEAINEMITKKGI